MVFTPRPPKVTTMTTNYVYNLMYTCFQKNYIRAAEGAEPPNQISSLHLVLLLLLMLHPLWMQIYT